MSDEMTQAWLTDYATEHVQTVSVALEQSTGVEVLSAQTVQWCKQLPLQMLEAVDGSEQKRAAFSALAQIVADNAALAAVVLFERSEEGPLVTDPMVLAGKLNALPMQRHHVAALCQKACKLGTAEIASGNAWSAVAVPVVSRGTLPEAVCAVLPADAAVSVERVAQMVQFAAAHMTLWYVLQNAERSEQNARHSAALLEMFSRAHIRDTIESACLALANDLQEFLGCEKVAVGICHGWRQHCQLKAIAGRTRFDKHAEFAQAIETTFDDTLLKDQITIYRSEDSCGQAANRSFKQLNSAWAADSAICVPLANPDGRPVGALLLVNPIDRPGQPTTENFVRASKQAIGSYLQLVQSAQPGRLGRVGRVIRRQTEWPRATVAVVAAVVLIVTLCWPFTHTIDCDCTVQPVLRRFVAAPYEGILSKTLVEPGDEVTKDQVLAEMDGREIRLKMSSLDAEYQRARKAWEVSLSTESIAEAQQANLEMKRLALNKQMLTDRQKHLQIRSPISGIVVSGDIEKSEGAPLTMGQNLFEIAPTGRMTVEIDIPEEDIAHVTSEMEMQIRLDAYPRKVYSARIRQMVPRAQARDDRMIFLGKTELDNVGKSLRPGMSGTATLLAPPRCLAWILFHKPYESLLMAFGW